MPILSPHKRTTHNIDNPIVEILATILVPNIPLHESWSSMKFIENSGN